MKAEEAANLFFMARDLGGENAEEDKHALTVLLNTFGEAGYEQAINENSIACPGCSSEAGAVRHMPPICLPLHVNERVKNYFEAIGCGTEVSEESLAKLVQDCVSILKKHPVKDDSEKMTMDEVLKEITAHYKEDSIKPGIQMAWLPDQDKVYTAVHRFPHGLQSRTVVAKAVEPTIEDSLGRLLYVWRRIVKES